MTKARDLTTDGVKIVDRGTPEQAMRFLAGLHCENLDEMDSVSDFHIWVQLPATLCHELVAMALMRTPKRHNEDRVLVEIVHLRKQEDPDSADWESFDLPNVQSHLTAIVRQAMQQGDVQPKRSLFASSEEEEYVDPSTVLLEHHDSLEDEGDDDHELDTLERSGIDNVVPIRPRRHLASVPHIA